MSCWHYPYAEYNTCWRCDYVRDFCDRVRISWTLTFAVMVALLIVSCLP
jgi:hypothetical protein